MPWQGASTPTALVPDVYTEIGAGNIVTIYGDLPLPIN